MAVCPSFAFFAFGVFLFCFLCLLCFVSVISLPYFETERDEILKLEAAEKRQAIFRTLCEIQSRTTSHGWLSLPSLASLTQLLFSFPIPSLKKGNLHIVNKGKKGNKGVSLATRNHSLANLRLEYLAV